LETKDLSQNHKYRKVIKILNIVRMDIGSRRYFI